MEDFKNKAIVAARWTSLLRYLSTAINIAGGIYLARMIAPDIFGQIGLRIAVISFITMASMWGFLEGFMKRSGRIQDNIEYLNTLFTIDFVISGITLLILIAVSFVFPKTLGLLLIIMTLSKAPMIFTEMHRATFVKEIRFDKLFVIHFTAIVVSVFCACLLAYYGYGLWALVSKFVIENICIGILSLALSSYRLKFHFNKEMAKDFYHFAKFNIIALFLESGYTSLDRIFMGSFLGTLVLGFYGRAQAIAGYVHSLLWTAVSPVFESLFGNLKDDKGRLSRVYNLGSCFFFRVDLLIFVCLGILAPEIITIVFGKEWLPTVPLFRLMLPFFILYSLRQLNKTIQLYTGRSKVVALAQGVEFVSFITCLLPLMYFLKIQGFILALNISIAIGLAAFLKYARKIVDLNVKEIFIKPLAMIAVSLAAFGALAPWLRNSYNVYLYVVFSLMIISMVYVGLSLLFERRFLKDIIQLIKVKKQSV